MRQLEVGGYVVISHNEDFAKVCLLLDASINICEARRGPTPAVPATSSRAPSACTCLRTTIQFIIYPSSIRLIFLFSLFRVHPSFISAHSLFAVKLVAFYLSLEQHSTTNGHSPSLVQVDCNSIAQPPLPLVQDLLQFSRGQVKMQFFSTILLALASLAVVQAQPTEPHYDTTTTVAVVVKPKSTSMAPSTSTFTPAPKSTFTTTKTVLPTTIIPKPTVTLHTSLVYSTSVITTHTVTTASSSTRKSHWWQLKPAATTIYRTVTARPYDELEDSCPTALRSEAAAALRTSEGAAALRTVVPGVAAFVGGVAALMV